MYLQMPSDFEPRFDQFELNGFFDETLREGAERCPVSIPGHVKIRLAKQILMTGVRDLIFGSGPSDPDHIAELITDVEAREQCPADWSATFILLLHCWEPIYRRFRGFPDAAKDKVCISLAMLDYKQNEALFERVVDKFRALGFTRFRVSLLNSFQKTVDEVAYGRLIESIDRSVAVGIDVVRINDSLGEIYPESLAILAANLRTQYPDLHFCLHAHDDKGLGLQNALTSVYYGFDYIEAAFAGFGNRSGLPAIETLNEIFKEKDIQIRHHDFDRKHLIDTAREVERAFFAVPDVYRPTSGLIVNWENMGVANIPDYLGSERDARRFLNDVGLHPQTIHALIDETEVPGVDTKDAVLLVAHRLSEVLQARYFRKREQFNEIVDRIDAFYSESVVFESHAKAMVRQILSENASLTMAVS